MAFLILLAAATGARVVSTNLLPAADLPGLFGAGEKISLRLPFRVTDREYRFKTPDKDDVKLFVNGQPRPVTNLWEQEKSISAH